MQTPLPLLFLKHARLDARLWPRMSTVFLNCWTTARPEYLYLRASRPRSPTPELNRLIANPEVLREHKERSVHNIDNFPVTRIAWDTLDIHQNSIENR